MKEAGKLPAIRQTLTLHAPIEKVWEAVSTSEGIAAWFMPNDFQPVKGHEFRLHTPYGVSSCKVTELDPPNRLTFTWGANWVVTFELHERGNHTEFTLIHDGWEAGKQMAETGEKQEVVRDRMDSGWGSAVLPRLKSFVEA